MTKQELHEMFANKGDDFWDVKVVENEGSFFTGTGYSGVCCTGYALRIQQKLGEDRVKVMGFYSEANPSALILTLADGHDFAVVDGKFIVDPWLTEVEDGCITSFPNKVILLGGQVVFDLAEDSELVRTLYGDPELWSTLNV